MNVTLNTIDDVAKLGISTLVQHVTSFQVVPLALNVKMIKLHNKI